MHLKAPAKINLWLRVLGKRGDGYHRIETRMAPLSLHDSLSVSRGEVGQGLDFTCSCGERSVPSGEENLVVRAIRSLEEAASCQFDVAVHLEKRIPSGAGLGGGSSDAASVLRCLNRWLPSPLSTAELSATAAKLGADIPFFLLGSPADCSGIGEITEPVPPIGKLPVFLMKPGFGVPTPWAYTRWSEAVPLPGIDFGEQETPWGRLVNDLERPVFEKYLVLADMKRWLRAREGVVAALMSGSGATVFALTEDSAAHDRLAAEAKAEFGESTWVYSGEVL